VHLDVDATGSVDDLDAEAVLTAEGLAAAGQAFERVSLALTAAGALERLTGGLDANAVKAAGDLTLASAYTFDGERLTLDRLRLAGPGLDLGGGVAVDLTGPALDGRLEGGSSNLAELGRWLGVPLGGTLDVALGLTPEDEQSAELQATLRDVDAAGLELARLTVDLEARTLLATPRLDGTVDMSTLVSGATVVDRAQIAVTGDLERLAVEFDTAGRLPQPFDLASAATVALGDGTTAVTLERLAGEVATLPIELRAPARLTLEGPTIALDQLTVAIDTATLAADARLEAERVRADLALTGLRLERLDELGVPPFQGGLDANVSLAGTRASPVVEANVDLVDLLPEGSAGAPAELSLDARLGGGRLDAALTTAGLGEPALGVDARLPVRFALEPFVLAPPDPLPLDATVAGTIDLARVAAWYGLDGIIVDGRLAADLDVAGNAAAPQLDGGLTLADGRVVDVATGILLEDLTLDAVAEGQRLVVREFSANDGKEGRISADGAVAFGGDGGVDLDVAARMTSFAVLQSEDLFIVMSGDADVSGRGGDMDVTGRFRVDRGEVFIAQGEAARDFAALDVVEREAVGSAEGGDEGEAGSAAPAGVIALDITIDIPGQLFVRGPSLVSEWGGTLAVAGTAAAPRVQGTIEHRRGHFDLFNRRFEFRRGEIQFVGATPPDPFIDVAAVFEFPDTTAVIALTGPALDPEIEISSEPPAPDDEIFARLLFNREEAQLNAVQALKVAAAVERLRGGGRGFFDRIRGGLGLDTLDVGGESADDATLRAGTYVNERTFFEIERGLSPGSTAARVEVELTPRIKVQTTVQEDQNSSVGLRWSYDY